MTSTAGRWQGFGTTIFTEMSALAERTGAINLGQGFPDEDGPEEVLEAARRAVRDGHNQYAALPGICEPGDDVVCFEPFYDSYAAGIAMAGAVRRPVTLAPPNWTLDPDP